MMVDTARLRAAAAHLYARAAELEATIVTPKRAVFSTAATQACDEVTARNNAFAAAYAQRLREDAAELEASADMYDHTDGTAATTF